MAYLQEYFGDNFEERLIANIETLQPYGDELMYNFTRDIYGIMFSGIFTHNMVLQREPYYASVYGTCDTPNTTIILDVFQDSQPFNEIITYSTISMDNGDWKILFNQTYPNGGNYTLSVFCDECGNNDTNMDILYNVTFGDIFFCSGQSNMNLELDFTFNRNYTYGNITKYNKYSNIRFFTKRKLATSFDAFVVPLEDDIMNGKYQWHQTNKDNIYHVTQFSATCWYMTQSLIDLYNMADVTFGLIKSAVGGSKIEVCHFNLH